MKKSLRGLRPACPQYEADIDSFSAIGSLELDFFVISETGSTFQKQSSLIKNTFVFLLNINLNFGGAKNEFTKGILLF